MGENHVAMAGSDRPLGPQARAADPRVRDLHRLPPRKHPRFAMAAPSRAVKCLAPDERPSSGTVSALSLAGQPLGVAAVENTMPRTVHTEKDCTPRILRPASHPQLDEEVENKPRIGAYVRAKPTEMAFIEEPVQMTRLLTDALEQLKYQEKSSEWAREVVHPPTDCTLRATVDPLKFYRLSTSCSQSTNSTRATCSPAVSYKMTSPPSPFPSPDCFAEAERESPIGAETELMEASGRRLTSLPPRTHPRLAVGPPSQAADRFVLGKRLDRAQESVRPPMDGMPSAQSDTMELYSRSRSSSPSMSSTRATSSPVVSYKISSPPSPVFSSDCFAEGKRESPIGSESGLVYASGRRLTRLPPRKHPRLAMGAPSQTANRSLPGERSLSDFVSPLLFEDHPLRSAVVQATIAQSVNTEIDCNPRILCSASHAQTDEEVGKRPRIVACAGAGPTEKASVEEPVQMTRLSADTLELFTYQMPSDPLKFCSRSGSSSPSMSSTQVTSSPALSYKIASPLPPSLLSIALPSGRCVGTAE